MAEDRYRLADVVARLGGPGTRSSDAAARLERLRASIAQSQARRAQRLAKLPRPQYPSELPVVVRREEIARAIREHQVTIVCGETGSGKTTQLPKICLELNRGVGGLVGHTQPRRIAARTVAARISQELGTPLGTAVGYKVRFQDKTDTNAYIKLMTDGILLAESQGDRLLSAYDTLIIDEAHERSLNIDFLLGYLRQLLPKRPDLKLIITSATIDAERFSDHFGGAPVIEVSGRLYPVEMRYRPWQAREKEDEEGDLVTAILDAVDEAVRCGPGHVLVFLPGEREIRDTAEALRKHHPPGAEILPLYARLSAAEQERVFESTNARRIVLSTNVAETSLTVPGVRYVIDSGLARVNRYSYRNKVEQLLIEKVSQASANQRAGRCGRVMSGICFRLYEEADFLARPRFTDPEVLRSSLAGVILRMKALELGDVERFPFIDPPQPRMVSDGYQLLAELGAVDEARKLTHIGRDLARLPIDPRIGRMVLEGGRQNCLTEILIIAAALSIQDPRERPIEKAQAADERHAPFRDERSDFVGMLKLWSFYDDLLKHKKSNRKLAQDLREHFLSPLRMREWREVHGQLHALLAETGAGFNESEATYERIHRALLSGLLGNIGAKRDDGDYDGARGIRFGVHPGSALRKRQPKWVVAAELVETTRLFARVAAQIEPTWIEQAAPHLVKRSWLEPRWDKERAQVVAWEQVSLYGLVLVARRRVPYGPIDPAHARDIFLRAGLVEGGYASPGAFARHNERLRGELIELENKSRRRDVLVDEHAMYRFFDARIPADIHSGSRFEAWRKQAEKDRPQLLFMTREDLMRHGVDEVSVARFPDAVAFDGGSVKLRYRFEPGHPLDGVTALVPLHLLNRLKPQIFEWLVPGMLRDKVNVLVRALPKHLRRACVPLPDTVTACLERMEQLAESLPLTEALSRALHAARGISAPPDTWEAAALPAHLRMNFSVIDEHGTEVATGRDLASLQQAHGTTAQAQFAPQSQWERAGIRAWESLELPEAVEFVRGKERLQAYPALLDEQDSVRLTLLDTADSAAQETRRGVSRLVRLALKEQVRALERSLTPSKQLALGYLPYGSADDLRESLVQASIDRAVWADEKPVRDANAFTARLQQVRARLQIVAQEYLRLAEQILSAAQAVRKELDGAKARAFKHAAADLARQLQALVFPGFIAQMPYAHLQHYPRYIAAMRRRLEKLPLSPERDEQHTRELGRWWQQLQQRVERNRKAGRVEPGLEEFRWMLEEQRVSLFAQELRTPYPVSYKRLERAWSAIV
ncbi:MAG: ATP-dependent RNA helicase HrpA [Betaproteobacteria bacterium]|nr:MAG: ATP-dependent RNA helicase HrpA [Betaproteobacteria bacterium]